MEYNNQNEVPQPQTPSTNTKNRTVAVVVGIIVGILVVYGMYIYLENGQKVNENTSANQQMQGETATPQAAPQATPQDTTSAIQNDLQGIDASGINTDLQDVNQQLNNL